MATVLHLEDDSAIQVLVRRTLERGGHTVISVDNIEEARRVLDERAVDALISDNTVLDGKGLDFIDSIKDRNIPTIFMSSEVIALQRDELYNRLVAGNHIDAVVSKPIEGDALLIALEKINIHVPPQQQTAPPAAAPAQPAATAISPLMQRRVLVIDGYDPADLAAALGDEGAIVETASNTEEAKQKLDGGRYDVVTLRVTEEGEHAVVDGKAIIEHMQATRNQTPVVTGRRDMMENYAPDTAAALTAAHDAGMRIEETQNFAFAPLAAAAVRKVVAAPIEGQVGGNAFGHAQSSDRHRL